MPVYINPYTDFGFKKMFGEEANKEVLIAFLNLTKLSARVRESQSYQVGTDN